MIVKTARISADGTLLAHGFITFALQPGDQVVPVPDDFTLEPGKWTYNGEAFVARIPTASEVQQAIVVAVQEHLDTAARGRGYDDCRAAISYRGDSMPLWAHEAEAFFVWRSQVWQTCLAMLGEVQQGLRAIPTADEVIAALPALVI